MGGKGSRSSLLVSIQLIGENAIVLAPWCPRAPQGCYADFPSLVGGYVGRVQHDPPAHKVTTKPAPWSAPDWHELQSWAPHKRAILGAVTSTSSNAGHHPQPHPREPLSPACPGLTHPRLSPQPSLQHRRCQLISTLPPPLVCRVVPMARAAPLVGALLVAGSLLAGAPAAAAFVAAAASAGDGRTGATNAKDALREAAKDVQLLVLKKTCDEICQANVVSSLEAAGCDEVRLFPALKLASAHCAPAAVAASAEGRSGGWNPRRLSGVQSASADAVVPALPPLTPATSAESTAVAPGETIKASRFWGLDRVNQRNLPLDGVTFPSCFPRRGAGVTVYILDSGLKVDHAQFGDRASVFAAPGSPYPDGSDENGHGSHVAGTVGGATAGVAPESTLVGIRVANAGGFIRARDAWAAIHYVAAVKERDPKAKIILNASFGSDSEDFSPVTDAANRAAEAGVVFVAAAGNEPVNACRNHPARAEGAITVAAVNLRDRLAYFSARGRQCVAVSAPGVGVQSVDSNTSAGLRLDSGTSMAAPHVAGLAALVLAEDPNGGSLGQMEVLERLTRAAPRVGGYPLAWANPACSRARMPEGE